ncbi:MAG: GNAT family N-acetyltransferase [Pirellulaceae bacterium]|nr:GNAT family N-acetyltransferase [Pirellulaceae bacterium]
MNAEIVRAGIHDAALLASLGARWFTETFQGTCTDEDMREYVSDCYSVARVSQELADADDLYHLMRLNQHVVGYSRMKASSPPQRIQSDTRSIELKRLYFDRQWQGLGLAQQMMQHHFQLVASMGFRRIFLSVWEHNQRARAFYQKLGFRNTGIANSFPIGQTPQTDYWYVLDVQ